MTSTEESDRFQVVPAPSLLAGHIGPLLEDSLGHMTNSHAEYGDCIGMRLGPRWLYSFAHPDDVQAIMVTGWRAYSKKTRVYELLIPLLGTGLFNSDGEAWKERRKLAQPAFHRDMLALFAQTMTDEACDLASRWEGQTEVDVAPAVAETALRIVARTTFGAQLSDDEIDSIRRTLTDSIDGITKRLHSVVSPPLWMPTSENRALNASLKTLHGLVDSIIERGDETGEGALAAMLTSGGLSAADLRDDLITFIFAGHESSATGLAWTLYLCIHTANGGGQPIGFM